MKMWPSGLMLARNVVKNAKKCTFEPTPDQPCNIFWSFLLQTYSFVTRYPMVCCLTETDNFQNDPLFGVLICLSADTENGFWCIRGPQGGCFGTKLGVGVQNGVMKGLCVGNWERAGAWVTCWGKHAHF